MASARIWLQRAGWVAAALLLALGGAGLVAGGDHPPGDATRPELTWRADGELAPALAELRGRYERLSTDVDGLSELARQVLADLLARDTEKLRSTLDAGSATVTAIVGQTGEIEAAIAALPHAGEPGVLGEAMRVRLTAASGGVDAIRDLPDQWAALARGTAPAVEVTRLLESHDVKAFEATQVARREQWADALDKLAEAVADLDAAAALRDELAVTVDVETLTSWIDRNRLHDTALAELYAALEKSGGRATDEVKQAIKKQEEAAKLLPPDTRGLVIIMNDIATGGVNQAAIAIETARGDLAAAIAALD